MKQKLKIKVANLKVKGQKVTNDQGQKCCWIAL